MREKRRQDREISRQDSRSDGAGRQKTNGERGREGPRKDRGLSKARESGLFNGDRDGGSQMDGRMDVDAWEEERERTQKIVAFGQMFDMKRKKDCRRDTLLSFEAPVICWRNASEFFVL